ncbi:MAG: hypothetical protein Q9223_002992 [Gallowayella weberi]
MAPAAKSSKKRLSSADSNNDYQSDNGFVADAPKTKKTKTSSVIPSHTAAKPTTASNSKSSDEDYWEITPTRRISIDDFKGSKLVNIREYYPDKTTGAMLPGKKGISLPLAQYSTLLTLLPNIEAALAAKGETVPRPQYDGAKISEDDPPDEGAGNGDEVEDDEAPGDGRKKNFEATSEEDE